jgi:lipoate-protein ligase A
MLLDEIMAACRVFRLPKSSGAFNTVIDDYFLHQVTNKSIKDFVILLTDWEPTVSVGNSQSVSLDVDADALRKHSVELVRRSSGGQSVLLDDGYVVFSAIGSRSNFPKDITKLREYHVKPAIDVLHGLGVPADFYPPDNIVISGEGLHTIGNAGQIITRDAVVVHGSIRYSLSEESLQRMVDILKINGHSLQQYKNDIRGVLRSIKEFSSASKADLQSGLVRKIAQRYGFNKWEEAELTKEQVDEIKGWPARSVEDRPSYGPRGVCNLYLKGRCVVPSIAHFLPVNKPSTHIDSTYE